LFNQTNETNQINTITVCGAGSLFSASGWRLSVIVLRSGACGAQLLSQRIQSLDLSDDALEGGLCCLSDAEGLGMPEDHKMRGR
jgi:hypothetical protein